MTLSELLDNEDFRAGRKWGLCSECRGKFRFHGAMGCEVDWGDGWRVWQVGPEDLRASWRLVSPEKE